MHNLWSGWIAILSRTSSGRQLAVVQKPVTHGVPRRSMKTDRITRFLGRPPDAKRPSRVSPCQKSVIRCPTPKVASFLKNVTMSESLEELAREVGEFKASPLAKKKDSETSDESGPLPAPKSARVDSGRRHHRLPISVDHLMMCRNGRSEESLLERRDGITWPPLGRSSSLCRSARFLWSKTDLSFLLSLKAQLTRTQA